MHSPSDRERTCFQRFRLEEDARFKGLSIPLLLSFLWWYLNRFVCFPLINFLKRPTLKSDSDWFKRVHYISIRHAAYVTRMHHSTTYACNLHQKNLTKAQHEHYAGPPLWLRKFLIPTFFSTFCTFMKMKTKVLTIKILKEQKRRKGFPDLTED